MLWDKRCCQSLSSNAVQVLLLGKLHDFTYPALLPCHPLLLSWPTCIVSFPAQASWPPRSLRKQHRILGSPWGLAAPHQDAVAVFWHGVAGLGGAGLQGKGPRLAPASRQALAVRVGGWLVVCCLSGGSWLAGAQGLGALARPDFPGFLVLPPRAASRELLVGGRRCGRGQAGVYTRGWAAGPRLARPCIHALSPPPPATWRPATRSCLVCGGAADQGSGAWERGVSAWVVGMREA